MPCLLHQVPSSLSSVPSTASPFLLLSGSVWNQVEKIMYLRTSSVGSSHIVVGCLELRKGLVIWHKSVQSVIVKGSQTSGFGGVFNEVFVSWAVTAPRKYAKPDGDNPQKARQPHGSRLLLSSILYSTPSNNNNDNNDNNDNLCRA